MAKATVRFSKKCFEAMLERIEKGESILAICRDSAMPHASTFYRWLQREPGLVERYRLSREIQADLIFAEILDIADDRESDWLAAADPAKPARANTDHIQRAKLRIDTRKWLVAKLAPKKYGDKLALEHDVSAGMASLLKLLEAGRKRASQRVKPEA